MELKNGYKVIYDKAANGEHVFYASKTGVFADAEEIGRIAVGEYKLVYEKAGQFYGSATGIPAASDAPLTMFDKVFAEASASAASVINEPVVEEPKVNGEAPVEGENPEVNKTEE